MRGHPEEDYGFRSADESDVPEETTVRPRGRLVLVSSEVSQHGAVAIR